MLSFCVLFGKFGFPACLYFDRLCLSGTSSASRHLVCQGLMCGKPKQRLDVRKTVACTQADNSQVTTLFTHASHNSRCFQLWPRPPAFRERLAPDDTTKRRAKAHALPASTSPSLVFPQHQPAAAAAHAPPCSSACGLATRHGAANSTEGTTGAPQKMRRQDAATPGPTNQVFVGDVHGLRLPHKRFVTL